ncbi:MAG: hypothetical protein IJ695_00795 [Butyrivibrio sp.]|nr:hypothetical protein [Butyrivibrio sp.]
MTSANLSLVNRIKMHRTYVGRTLWISLVLLPFFAVYFILGVIMMVSRAINYAAIYNQSAQELYHEKLLAVHRIVGFSQIGFILVIISAILFALQGFSYVFNMGQMDFFLSQPTTRAQRIRKNYINAFTTFFAIYFLPLLISLVIAAVMGAVNSNIIAAALLETMRAVILFAAIYNVSVLSVLLTGSLPIAILLTATFLAVPVVISGEIELYKSIFFATYSYAEPFNVYLSPLFDRFGLFFKEGFGAYSGNYIASKSFIADNLKLIIPGEADTCLVAIIAFCLALIVSKLRKAEWAGKSIPLRPVRWCIKITVCVLSGLAGGLVVYALYSAVWNSRLYFMMVAVMVLVTIFVGCMAEVIFESSIKRFFKGFPQTVMALAIVVLVFIIYRGDLLGFDSFVPAPEKISSCAILNSEKTFQRYNSGYLVNDFSAKDYMHLTDTQSFVEIAKVGMKTQKERRKSEQMGNYDSLGYNMTILYRLKSGGEMYRSVTVPYDIVDDRLEKIISSDEYKEGSFECFHDDDMRELDKRAQNRILRYTTPVSVSETRDFSYAEFSDAYREDIKEAFDFSRIKNLMPIGSVEFEVSGSEYAYAGFDIYEGYENSIALLDKYGIYYGDVPGPDNIAQIRVTNYYPGYDLEETDQSEIPETVDSQSATYYDSKSVREILDGAVSTSFYNQWYNYNNNNSQYGIQITSKNNMGEYGGSYYTFIKGKVPQFVIEDTNK